MTDDVREPAPIPPTSTSTGAATAPDEAACDATDRLGCAAAWLECVTCRGELEARSDALSCTRCGATWPMRDEVIALMPRGVAGDYALSSDQRALVRVAAAQGWRAALHEHVRRSAAVDEAYVAEYVSSEARADFRFVMPIPERAVILDLGSGWGNIATAFARTARRVIAVDTNADNLRFVHLRAAQEGLRNVTVVQCDACDLPIRAGTVDAVSMVGVLEWVAWGHDAASPHELQRRALAHVHRVLRPGGSIYLAIENRYSAKYFLGQREPHTKMRFVSLVPYRVADAWSRLVRRQPYREVTYSLHALRELLRSVGFDDISVYFPVPGYQNFRFLVDLGDRTTTRYVVQRLRVHPRYSALYRIAGAIALLLPLSLTRALWPTFGVVATRR